MLQNMRARVEVPAALRRLAECQAGVLSREQVLGHGLSSDVTSRLVRSEVWQRLANGIYLTHPLPPPWEALAWGGILLGGPRARLGPEASGHLHGFASNAPDPLDVLTPADTLITSRDHWHFVRERPGVRSGRVFGSPPRLGVEDTVLDLADRRAEGQVVGLVTRAVNGRLTTAERLQRQLSRRARHRHRDLLTGMLAEVDEGAESPSR